MPILFSYILDFGTGAAFPFILTFDKITFRLLTFITRESSCCFQRVLAIAILSVCPSVTPVDQSKTVQARIIKSSPSAAWKTVVSGTVKLFHAFEGGVTPNEGAK